MKNYVLVTSLVFAIVGLVHALRLFNNWEVSIGGWMVPTWVSWLALLLAVSLVYWGRKVAKVG